MASSGNSIEISSSDTRQDTHDKARDADARCVIYGAKYIKQEIEVPISEKCRHSMLLADEGEKWGREEALTLL